TEIAQLRVGICYLGHTARRIRGQGRGQGSANSNDVPSACYALATPLHQRIFRFVLNELSCTKCSCSDLTRAIKDKVAQITSSLRTSVACAIETGALLIEAKKRVGHGNFEQWVADNFPISPATARRWMELAEKRPKLEKQLAAKTLNLSDLNLSSARRLIEPPKTPTPAQSEQRCKTEKPKTEKYKSIENDRRTPEA